MSLRSSAASYVRNSSALGLLVLATNHCGAGSSGLRVDPVRVSAEPPGRVTALVEVTARGRPAADIDARNFEVREGDVVLDPQAISLEVQPLDDLGGHEALLLVDMSQPLAADERPSFESELGRFITQLSSHQAVAVYAFDGSDAVRSIARYPRGSRLEGAKDPGLTRLANGKPQGSSSNLYAALVRAEKELEARVDPARSPLAVATLIVIARAPDTAGKTPEREAKTALAERRTFLLKLGRWAGETSVDWIGRESTKAAASVRTMSTPLTELSEAIDGVFARSFLVSYCSPARAGTRDLRLTVELTDDAGKLRRGSANSTFDAKGFGPGCSGSQKLAELRAPASGGRRKRPGRAEGTSADRGPKPAADEAAKDGGSSASTPAGTPIVEPPSGLGYE